MYPVKCPHCGYETDLMGLESHDDLVWDHQIVAAFDPDGAFLSYSFCLLCPGCADEEHTIKVTLHGPVALVTTTAGNPVPPGMEV